MPNASSNSEEYMLGPLRLADSQWLADCASGAIDVRLEILKELTLNRGCSPEGKWIGFDKAREALEADARKASDAVAEAGRKLGFSTLESRNSDRLDFRDVNCASLERVLREVYESGMRQGARNAKARMRHQDNDLKR